MSETSAVPLNQQPGVCPYCSTPTSATFHGGTCPKVRFIEYYPDGSIKRVDFHSERAPSVNSSEAFWSW